MTAVDAAVLVAFIAAMVVGVRVGGLVIGGFVGGLVGGSALGLTYVPGLTEPLAGGVRFMAIAGGVMGAVTLLVVAGYHGGMALHRRLRARWLVWPDRIVGGAMGGMIALVVMVFCGSALTTTSAEALRGAVAGSAVLTATDGVLPSGAAVGRDALDYLAGMEGLPVLGGSWSPESVELASERQVAAAVGVARRATVPIVALGCTTPKAGSGVAVADGVVATNAHVVAGATHIHVAGDRVGTPLLVDHRLDVAVLGVPDLDVTPLPFADEDRLDRGETAVALGYPMPDRTFRAAPAAVLELQRRADAEDAPRYSREVYQLATDARPGGSGGPLVDADGEIVGLMFGRAERRGDVGYAVTAPAVADRVAEALLRRAPAATGVCP